jgi:heme exporter protein B
MIGALIARDLRRASAARPGCRSPSSCWSRRWCRSPSARRALLARIGGGALWIAALTAALLPIERLIEPDRADGVLDQLALRGVAEESVAAAKIAAHWLTFGPLLLLARARLGAARLPARRWPHPAVALAIGTPALAALAVAVAALTAGLPRAGALGGLLLLPLAVPLLIFGAAASGDAGVPGACCWRPRCRC